MAAGLLRIFDCNTQRYIMDNYKTLVKALFDALDDRFDRIENTQRLLLTLSASLTTALIPVASFAPLSLRSRMLLGAAQLLALLCLGTCSAAQFSLRFHHRPQDKHPA